MPSAGHGGPAVLLAQRRPPGRGGNRRTDLYCYPNPADGTVFGQPVTRLVVEGKLRGVTYYYPIDLPGLEADTQYNLDITLTRTGTADPDIPAASGTILLQDEVLEWDERDLEDVFYR